MAFLLTKVTDSFRLVFSEDPAIEKPEDVGEAWIDESAAPVKSGARPDVLICRPLSGEEVLRVVVAVEEDPALVVQAAALGVVSIELGDGSKVTDPSEVRGVLSNSQNLHAIPGLAQRIIEVSREGLDDLGKS